VPILVYLLDHVVSADGVAPDPGKMQKVLECPSRVQLKAKWR